MYPNRRLFVTGALAAAIVLAAAAPVRAADEQNLSRGLTAEGAPLAMHGYDPVAFFTAGAPTLGGAEHAVVHRDATFYFASEANREAFEADPERYVPAYGGYCAFGVSVGKKFDGDPRHWTISGGRLYLNLNEEIAAKFREDVAGAVAKADAQWRKIEHSATGEL